MIRAAALLLALVAAAPARAAYPYDSVCKVLASHASGFRSYAGSGVLIASNDVQALVLTVQHVAIRSGRVVVCEWGTEQATGRVIAVADNADVALLLVAPVPSCAPVPVALPTPDSGPFVLCGYPGYDRDTLRWQSGAYLSLSDSTLGVQCRPEKGMSGGPAFDRYGRVVGAVSSFHRRQNVGYCGSGVAMLELVDRYMKPATNSR